MLALHMQRAEAEAAAKENPWRPLRQRLGMSASCLHEGVPPWLHQSLLSWLEARFTVRASRSGTMLSRERLERYERECRHPLLWRNESYAQREAFRALCETLKGDSDRFLESLDWAVRDGHWQSSLSQEATKLETILSEGGSAWRVAQGPGRLELQRRVPVELQDLAEVAFETSSGSILAEAWSAAFGLDPNPSEAYTLAVKAVEGPLIALAQPNHAKARFGMVLGEVKAGRTSLDSALDAADGRAMVESMLRSLWFGHRDRHPSPDPNARAPMTIAEGRAAVELATLLVHWLATGSITVGG